MTTKDYILIFISAAALTLSIISLVVTLIQKNRETKRTIRKNLSDTLENISKIAIESTKLRASKDIDFNSEAILLLRRNYNSQRRVLIAHADFLVEKYGNIATEIDCNILAGAYATIGDIEGRALLEKNGGQIHFKVYSCNELERIWDISFQLRKNRTRTKLF